MSCDAWPTNLMEVNPPLDRVVCNPMAPIGFSATIAFKPVDASPRISDEDVERIAKRVAELLREPEAM